MVTFSPPIVRVNEAYPDPEMDINGDGYADQNDEFIELFNSGDQSVDLDGWTVTDNGGSYTINKVNISGRGYLYLPRTLTGIVLGANENISLFDEMGNYVDHLAFESAKKGMSYHRAPDGSDRIRALKDPTPGSRNHLPPAFLINEVMPDPVGKNAYGQWVELLNIGDTEDLKGSRLTNTEGVDVILPSMVLCPNERGVVCIGNADRLGPRPPDVQVVQMGSSSTLYVVGDELQLIDPEGYAMDYVAWGSSSHVGAPIGIFNGTCWKGKVYDRDSYNMTTDGLDNPTVREGLSLMRVPDGSDSDSPLDWTSSPSYMEGTPGWSNDRDISMVLSSPIGIFEFDVDEELMVDIFVAIPGENRGDIILNITPSSQSWTVTNVFPNILSVTGENSTSFEVYIKAPKDIYEHESDLSITATWQGMEWYFVELILHLIVPSIDLFFEDVSVLSEGSSSAIVPQGLLIDIHGYVNNQGELRSASFSLDILISGQGSEEEIVDRISIDGVSPDRRKAFKAIVDTIDLEGNHTIKLSIDRDEEIPEFDRSNNVMIVNISVIPTPILDGEASLVIARVLWNTTSSSRFVTLANPGDPPIDISLMHISDGIRSIRFPEGSTICPREEIAIVWGEAAIDRSRGANRTFRCDGLGDVDMRMIVEGALPDPASTGFVKLDTRFRKNIDMVQLRRTRLDRQGWSTIAEHMVESTYGTMTFRASREGRYIDTNTSMDWHTNNGRSNLYSLSPSPSSGSSGEFVSMRFEEGVDPSGFMLVCNNRIAVIPNGTIPSRKGSITIAGNANDYLISQGDLPDLLFGEGDIAEGGEIIKGTRVPGYASLVLPNAGAELIVIDPSGRPVDSLKWGPEGIGSVKNDMVLRSTKSSGDLSRWSVAGKGSFPIVDPYLDSGVRIEAVTILSDASYGLDWLGGGGDLLVLTSTFDPKLARLAETTLSMGHNATVHLVYDSGLSSLDDGNGTGRSDGDAAQIENFIELGGKLLLRSGSDIPVNFYFRGSRILLSSAGISKEDTVEGMRVKAPVLGFEIIDPNDAIDLFRVIAGRENDWIPSAGDELIFDIEAKDHEGDQVRAMEDNGILSSIETDILYLHHASALPDVLFDEDEVFIYDARGNMDLRSILRSFETKASVRLLIGTGSVRPVFNKEYDLVAEAIELIENSGSDPSYPSERNHLLDALAIRSLASESISEIEIRISNIDPSFIGFGGFISSRSHEFIMLDMNDGMTNPFWMGHVRTGRSYMDSMIEPLWSGSLPLPWGLLGKKQAGTIISEHSELMIEEIYLDTYIPGDTDEFVTIFNSGLRPVPMKGCSISDDEGLGLFGDGMIIINSDIDLYPGERLYIAHNGDDFVSQNGFLPDLAIEGAQKNSGLIVVGSPRLANENDSVCLRDPMGVVMDVVPYGRCIWEFDHWPSSSGGSWEGPAVPVPGKGHVLHRERKYGDMSLTDTDRKEDWLTMRPKYPGQSSFGPFTTSKDASVRFGVCPDTSSDLMRDILEGSRSELLVNIYEMNSAWITTSLIGARERGVEVRVLVEGQPVGGMGWEQAISLGYLMAGGVDVRVMNNDPSGIRDRYRFDHAKYIVADGERVLISSDNFKDTSFPPPGHIPLTGTRGWAALVDSTVTAETVKAVFEEDWSGPDMVSYDSSLEQRDLTSLFNAETASVDSLNTMEPTRRVDLDSVTVLISPDHLGRMDNPLIETIRSAKEEIVVQLMSLSPSFDTPSQRSSMVPEPGPDAILHGSSNSENPYLASLFYAASRGVRVRIMLDGTDFDMDGRPDNEEVADWIASEAAMRGLDRSLSVKVMPSLSRLPGRGLGLVHNKGVVIDSRFCWISSLNWGPTSALENREMGFLMESEELGALVMEVLDHDWGLTLQNDIVLYREGVRVVPLNDEGSRVVLYLRDMGHLSDGVQLALTGEHSFGPVLNDTDWSDMAHDGNVTCVEYKGQLPRDGCLYLFARDGERTAYMFEVIIVSFGEEDLGGPGYPFYREPLFPVIVVLISALALSISVSLFRERSKKNDRKNGPLNEGREE